MLGSALPLYGQWARGAGNGYLQLSTGFASANRAWDQNYMLRPLGEPGNEDQFSEIGFYLYGEMGLTPQVTAIISTFWKQMTAENRNSTFTTSGLSDLNLSLRYSWQVTDAVVLSPQIGIKLPSGYDSGASPPLGSGVVDGEVGLQAGFSLYPVPAFVGSSIGFRKRGGLQEDEFFSHLEVGYQPSAFYILTARVDYLESLAGYGGDQFQFTNQNRIQGWLRAGPGLIMMVSEQINLSLSAQWMVRGRVTGNIFSLFGGVSYQW